MSSTKIRGGWYLIFLVFIVGDFWLENCIFEGSSIIKGVIKALGK